MHKLIMISIGAIMGALLRHKLAESLIFGQHLFFLKILLINVLGSSFLGLFLGLMEEKIAGHSALWALIITGFLGSFTTFSALSYDLHNLLQQGRHLAAFLNALTQLVLSLTAFFLLWRLGKWLCVRLAL